MTTTTNDNMGPTPTRDPRPGKDPGDEGYEADDAKLEHCAKCGKPMGDEYGVFIVLTTQTSIIMHEKCYEIFKDESAIPIPICSAHAVITNITLPEVGGD